MVHRGKLQRAVPVPCSAPVPAGQPAASMAPPLGTGVPAQHPLPPEGLSLSPAKDCISRRFRISRLPISLLLAVRSAFALCPQWISWLQGSFSPCRNIFPWRKRFRVFFGLPHWVDPTFLELPLDAGGGGCPSARASPCTSNCSNRSGDLLR